MYVFVFLLFVIWYGETEGDQELGREVEPDVPGHLEGGGGIAACDDGFGGVRLAAQVGGDAGEAGGGEVGLDAAHTAATAGQDGQVVGGDGGGGEREMAEFSPRCGWGREKATAGMARWFVTAATGIDRSAPHPARPCARMDHGRGRVAAAA